MNAHVNSRKQGWLLISSGVLVGLLFQALGLIIAQLNSGFSQSFLTVIGSGFNAVLMGLLIYLIIGDEFFNWFTQFNFKWVLIGLPALLLISFISGTIWSSLAGKLAQNSVNSQLNWQFVVTQVPFMLLGEELLSIGILYGAWKKLNWEFWQASLLCAILFAAWHLSSYDFNFLQCIVTLAPSRLALNYLFKQTSSLWVTLVVHFCFDLLTFLPILLS